MTIHLRAENLACRRGGRTVFTGVSFNLAQGRGLLLKGPNGTGKTSLLRTIADLGEIEGGKLELTGGDHELSIGQQAHYLGHQNALKLALTVEENLMFWARFLGQHTSPEEIRQHLGAYAMDRLASYSAGLLSAGQRRRLALSRLNAVQRPIWLLDEPSVGLDAASCQLLAKAMTGHMATGGILIATTHTDLGIRFDQTIDLGNFSEPA